MPEPAPAAKAREIRRTPSARLPVTARALRLRSGLSQRQLALRLDVARTYISKIETGNATPQLSTLEKLARALDVSLAELLDGGERCRKEEIRGLIKDPFIAEMLPFVSRLSRMQQSTILEQVHSLQARRRLA